MEEEMEGKKVEELVEFGVGIKMEKGVFVMAGQVLGLLPFFFGCWL